METKFEAIENFRFMKKIFTQIEPYKFEKDGNVLDILGVFFYGKYAYTTNGWMVGRVLIEDNIHVDKPMFWAYKDEDAGIKVNKVLLNLNNYCKPNCEINNLFSERFIGNLDLLFNRSADNCFFFRREYLLNLMEEVFGEREKAKVNNFLTISLTKDYRIWLYFEPKNITPKNQPVEDTIPLFSSPSLMHKIRFSGDSCCIQVYPIFNILKYSFPKNSIIGIKYSDNLPVTLFNKKNNIYWTIAQKS